MVPFLEHLCQTECQRPHKEDLASSLEQRAASDDKLIYSECPSYRLTYRRTRSETQPREPQSAGPDPPGHLPLLRPHAPPGPSRAGAGCRTRAGGPPAAGRCALGWSRSCHWTHPLRSPPPPPGTAPMGLRAHAEQHALQLRGGRGTDGWMASRCPPSLRGAKTEEPGVGMRPLRP